MNDKNKLVITTVAIAIALIATVMMVSADIELLGTDGNPGTGVNATVNTTFGGNTTIAQECRWLNFTANFTTTTDYGINVSNITLVFPPGFTVNTAPGFDFNNSDNVSRGGFEFGADNVSVSKSGDTLYLFNATGGHNITSNASEMFWINVSVGSDKALLINESQGIHEVNMTAWVWDNVTDNNATCGVNSSLVYLTVYNMRNVTATLDGPTEIISETLTTYNFTVNNTALGMLVDNVSIVMPDDFRCSGNVSDVVTSVGTVDSTNSNEGRVNITGVSLAPNENMTVNISNVLTHDTGSNGVFDVYVANTTEDDGTCREVYDRESNLTVTVATWEATAYREPTALEVQFKYGNWTVGDGAVNITVQSHDDDGNLTNASSYVFLKITSDNQQYANLLPADGIVKLDNGTNSLATINVTNAAQDGVYTVVAYDLNETDPEMTTATDNITYAAGVAGPATQYTVVANTTTPDVGHFVMLNVTLKDANGLETNVTTGYTPYLQITSNSSYATIYTMGNESYDGGWQNTANEPIATLAETPGEPGVYNCTLKATSVGTYNITVYIQNGATTVQYYGSPQSEYLTFSEGTLTEVNITSPANYSDKVVGGSVAIFAQAITTSASLGQPNLRVDFNLSGTAVTSVPPGWVNGSFSAHPDFAMQGSNDTHAWVYTNGSGIAAMYLNVSTWDDAKHNVTVSMSTDTASWNNTFNDTVNITATNSTRYRLNLTSDVSAAQVSGEADPDYNWVNLTATLKDEYNNKVEDADIIIAFTDSNENPGYGIFNVTSATTDSNGNATVKYRSAKAGEFTVTATNDTAGLTVPSGTTTVKFYGPPHTVKAEVTPGNTSTSTVGTPINVTISVLDSDRNVYEMLDDYVNVSVDTTYNSSSAALYNETGGALNVTGNWSGDNVSVSLTDGKGYILINDTTAESVLVQVWSTGLTAVYPGLASENVTLTFTPGALHTLNVTNVTASSVKYDENIKLKIEAHDIHGNVNISDQADLMPVKLQFNNTTVSVSSDTLADSTTGVNESNMPYILGRLTNGTANVTITSSTACGVNATATTTTPGVTDGGTDVAFTSHDWTSIKVETNRNVIVKNGTDYALLTISLLDAQGTVDTGSNKNGSDSITLAMTGGSGQLNRTTIPLGMLSSGILSNVSLNATAGPITVYASNATIMSSVNATVNASGYPAAFTVTPNSTTVNEGSNITLTVNVTDLNGNPVSFAGNFTVYVNNVSAAGAVLYNGSATAPIVDGTTSLLTGGNGTIVLTGVAAGTVNISVNSTSFGGTIESVNVTTITVTSAGYEAYTKGTKKLNLYSGWNCISVPKKLDASADTFGELGISFAEFSYKHDASTGTWVQLSATSTLEPLGAYWVNVASQNSSTLTYAAAGMAVPPSKQLYAGWNSIGFTSEDPTMANETLQSVTDKWSTVLGWDAVNQTYQTSLIKGSTSGDHSEGTNMKPGQGYWVWMTANDELAAISV